MKIKSNFFKNLIIFDENIYYGCKYKKNTVI